MSIRDPHRTGYGSHMAPFPTFWVVAAALLTPTPVPTRLRRLARSPTWLRRSTGRPDAPAARSAGAPSSTSTSAPAARSCSSTGSARRGRTGSRTCPTSRATHRCIAIDLPGFGASRVPRERSRSSATRARGRAAATRSGSSARSSWATRWAGSSRAELAIAFPTRVERLVLVPPPCSGQEYRRAQAAGRARAASAPRSAVRWRAPRARIVCAPRLRAAALQLAASATRQLLRASCGRAGPAAPARPVPAPRSRRCRLPAPRRLARGRVPDADRLGRNDPLVGVEHADELERADPDARKRDLRGHRPRRRCSSARRASTRCCDAFLAAARARAARRGALQRVIAPSAALPTSCVLRQHAGGVAVGGDS